MNRAIEQFLDEKGRLRETRWPGLAPTVMQYDTRGRLSTMSQGERVYGFAWNPQDRLASVTTPTGQTTSFGYDNAGRVVTQTFHDGRAISFAYDAAGNLTSLTPPGRPAHTFAYDDLGLTETATAPGDAATRFVYNRDRDLTQVIRPGGSSVTLTYDRGRPQNVSGGGRTLGLSYSSGGQLSGIADSAGPSLGFEHDGLLPTRMTWTGEVSGSVGWSYDASLRVSSESVNGASVPYCQRPFKIDPFAAMRVDPPRSRPTSRVVHDGSPFSCLRAAGLTLFFEPEAVATNTVHG